MNDKELCQLYEGYGIVSRDENYLLSELVNFDQNGVKPKERQEFLDEIHRNYQDN